MKKQVKKINRTQVGITFTTPEMAIYGFEEGDVIDLRDMVVIKKEKEE